MTNVFIIGNSRSGTKMIGNVLNRSSSIFTIESEIHFFEELYSVNDLYEPINKNDALILLTKLLSTENQGYLNRNKFTPKILRKYKQTAESIYNDELPTNNASLYKIFINYLRVKNKAKIICETTPRNQYFLQELRQIFSNPKLIYLYRDPRAVLNSKKNNWKSNLKKGRHFVMIRNIINYHPITISLLWNSSIKNYIKNRHLVYPIQYEKFINKPKDELKKLTDYIGIDYSEDLLLIDITNSSIVSSKKIGIYSDSRDVWMNNISSTEIFINQIITSKYLKNLNYRMKKNIIPNPFVLMFYLLYFPIHLIFVFFINNKRYKNIFSSIIKRLR